MARVLLFVPAALLLNAGCERARVRGLDADASAPALLDFGTVAVGQTATLSLAVTNTGAAQLAVEGAQVAAPFSSDAKAGPADPGAVFPLRVRFAPPAAGAFDEVLTLSLSSARTPSLSVRLKGTGFVPRLAGT